MKLGSTVPILRSFDEAKAKEFYMDTLGLQKAIERHSGLHLAC